MTLALPDPPSRDVRTLMLATLAMLEITDSVTSTTVREYASNLSS